MGLALNRMRFVGGQIPGLRVLGRGSNGIVINERKRSGPQVFKLQNLLHVRENEPSSPQPLPRMRKNEIPRTPALSPARVMVSLDVMGGCAASCDLFQSFQPRAFIHFNSVLHSPQKFKILFLILS